MAPRSRASFQKRQKEQARQEKQRAKAQRRQQKKLENQAPAERVESQEASPVAEGSPDPSLPLELDRCPDEGSHHPETTKEQS
ncbi:MAG: hypothetical protein ACXVZZ_12035 [Terriglobales bacterium]